MLTTEIKAEMLRKIEAVSAGTVMVDYADTTPYHPTAFAAQQMSGAVIEALGEDVYAVRDLDEDGQTFDLFFARHISGESLMVPVIK